MSEENNTWVRLVSVRNGSLRTQFRALLAADQAEAGLAMEMALLLLASADASNAADDASPYDDVDRQLPP